MSFTPYPCSGEEPTLVIDLLDQNGDYCNRIESSECFATWLCDNYAEMLTYPGVTSITWKVYVPPEPIIVEPPADPPIDPDPDEDA